MVAKARLDARESSCRRCSVSHRAARTLKLRQRSSRLKDLSETRDERLLVSVQRLTLAMLRLAMLPQSAALSLPRGVPSCDPLAPSAAEGAAAAAAGGGGGGVRSST